MSSLLPAHRLRKRALLAAATALASAAVTVMSAAAPAQADTPTAASRLQAGLNQGISDGYPGVIGLVRNGDDTVRLSAGTGNRGTGQAADPTARFRIGSLTKAFTATVLLQLEAENKLSLDDTVATWLPGAVATNGYDGTKITIRQLLNHTSGLPNYTSKDLSAYYLGTDLNATYPPQAVVTAVLNETAPRTPDNPVQARYSNINYILAGMVIQAVTGTDPATQINNRIIQPLGMHNTAFPVGVDTGMSGNFMYGYAYMGAWPFISLNERTSSNVQIFWTAGAMVSTLDDLSTFYRALLSGGLLPPAQTSELKTAVPYPDNSPGSTYGLGLIHVVHTCADGRQVPLWGHTGGVIGYFSYWISNEDGSKQVLVAANENHLADGGTPGQTHINAAAGEAICAM